MGRYSLRGERNRACEEQCGGGEIRNTPRIKSLVSYGPKPPDGLNLVPKKGWMLHEREREKEIERRDRVRKRCFIPLRAVSPCAVAKLQGI